MITSKTFNLVSLNENDLVRKLVETAASAREEAVLAHLRDLVEKGILVMKVDDWTFFRDELSNQLVYKEKVELQLNAQEYIDKLEKENSEMKEYIKEIKSLLNKGA